VPPGMKQALAPLWTMDYGHVPDTNKDDDDDDTTLFLVQMT